MAKTWNIEAFFQLPHPRAGQTQVMRELHEKWDDFDVAVIDMPVGSGKSAVADAVARYASSARTRMSDNGAVIVANNNVLLQQYLDNTRGYSTLRRRDAYWCRQHNMTCEERNASVGGHCRSPTGNVHHRGGCDYLRDLRGARSSDRLLVNQHIYLAHSLYRDVVIFDEAHTLQHMLQDSAAKSYWRREWGWRRELESASDVREWLDEVPAADFDARLELLRDVLNGVNTSYSLHIGEAEWRGRPEECVRLLPLDVRTAAQVMWPSRPGSKIVLMSATMNQLDIRNLGLDGKRVLYTSCPSPIPADQRPCHVIPVADMRYVNRSSEISKLASFLVEDVLPQHEGEKGLIHAPYSVARQLADAIGEHRRIRTHTVENKKDVVADWLRSSPHDGAVLVGSGLHEGLDLAGDRAGFQVITTTPRRSIGDPGLAWLAENRPEEYEWFTIRDLAQAYGRVCRGPDDYGTTIITDSSVVRELQSPQVPGWLREALIFHGE